MENQRNMIDTAYQLGRSLRCLQATGPTRPGEIQEEAENNSRLDFGGTGIFLYAMIVELTIKGLWSYENSGTEPEYTHHIVNIFSKLNRDTQTQIETIYENNRKYYTRVVSEGKRQVGEEKIQVVMASPMPGCFS